MKIGKSFGNGPFVMGIPSDDDFEIIKGMVPSGEIKQDELFTYKVVLCDNLVDRDFEMFSHKALESVVDLFKGVVGIEDHNPTVKNNHSRIYKTELVVDSSRHNEFGDDYECVVAYAYTLNNSKNKDLIDEIRSGLKKEVSIGFENLTKVCSICGHSVWECEHVIGHEYECSKNKKLCVGIIDSVDDAYEWSFVSIPAQRGAGIIKSFKNVKEESTMDIKELSLAIAPKLDSELAVKFMNAIDELTKPESETVKSLESRIKALEAEVDAKSKVIKEMEDAEHTRILSEAIEGLFGELKPKNDTLRDLAFKEIEDIVKIGEDGGVEGIDEAKAKLASEVYAPLFNHEEDEKGLEVETEDKGEDVEAIDSDEKSFSVRAKAKKSIDFTRISKFKMPDKKFSNTSVGIKTEC